MKDQSGERTSSTPFGKSDQADQTLQTNCQPELRQSNDLEVQIQAVRKLFTLCAGKN